MRLFKNDSLQDDDWQKVDDDAPLPASGKVLLSRKRWEMEKQNLSNHLAYGITIEPAATVEDLVPDLSHFGLIAIDFPKFSDGRGYSMARELRSYHGYKGELRATGDILYDQLQLLARCGFDSFDIKDESTLALLAEGRRPDLTRFYQPALGAEEAVDTRPWARRARKAP